MPQARTFATGGYDHIVHLWSTATDLDIPVPAALEIRHASAVYALLPVYDSTSKLLSGSADCSVSVYDIASERVVNTLKLSNPVYQLHPAISPFCSLVEVCISHLLRFLRQVS